MLKILVHVNFLWIGVIILGTPFIVEGISAQIDATVKITICGDSVVASTEECDGVNVGGASCSSLGFTGGGTLSCTLTCEFDVSQCIYESGVTGGGGGSGGGGSSTVSVRDTRVVFKGRAYPGSSVTILKDAQIAATTVAGPDAHFEISLSGLGSSSYIFSLYSEDVHDVRSVLQNFPIVLTSGATTHVTGVFIAPTVIVDKSEVKRGDNIAIFGQAVPSSEVTISINSEKEFFVKRYADAAGVYLLNFDTSVLEMGQHHTKSKAALNGEITGFGKAVGFTVGTNSVVADMSKVVLKGDVNGDGRVNLVDFSITAYWYKRPNPPVLVDLNGDGKVDLVDFSIMAFHWTG